MECANCKRLKRDDTRHDTRSSLLQRAVKSNKGNSSVRLEREKRGMGRGDLGQQGGRACEWIIMQNMVIENRVEEGPTFESTRGRSFIDLTTTKGIRTSNWRVMKEETLNDHECIRFETGYTAKITQRKIIYAVETAQWKKFEELVSMGIAKNRDRNSVDIEVEIGKGMQASLQQVNGKKEGKMWSGHRIVEVGEQSYERERRQRKRDGDNQKGGWDIYKGHLRDNHYYMEKYFPTAIWKEKRHKWKEKRGEWSTYLFAGFPSLLLFYLNLIPTYVDKVT